jgi:hypothetical protein
MASGVWSSKPARRRKPCVAAAPFDNPDPVFLGVGPALAVFFGDVRRGAEVIRAGFFFPAFTPRLDGARFTRVFFRVRRAARDFAVGALPDAALGREGRLRFGAIFRRAGVFFLPSVAFFFAMRRF